jgi:hypothetical protein
MTGKNVALNYKQNEHPKSASIAYRSDKPFKLFPTRMVYDLELDEHGYLRYREEDVRGAKWTDTVISVDRIVDFYESVDSQSIDEKLQPRPIVVNPKGEIGSFSLCDPKYCDLAHICDRYERDYAKWVSKVESFSTKED